MIIKGCQPPKRDLLYGAKYVLRLFSCGAFTQDVPATPVQNFLLLALLPCEPSQDMWVELKLVQPIGGSKIFVMGNIRIHICTLLPSRAVLFGGKVHLKSK